MGFLDRFKGKEAERAVEEESAQQEEDIDAAIDKVAKLADEATDGKFTEKIDEAAAKLKEAAERAEQAERAENDPNP